MSMPKAVRSKSKRPQAVCNRVSQLVRPSPQFPRRLVPAVIDLGEWNALAPLFEELKNRKISSLAELVQWLEDGSEVSAAVAEEESRRYIANSCATDDKEAEKAYLDFVENVEPHLEEVGFELEKKFLESPFVGQLAPDRYKVLVRSARNQVDLFRAENIPIQTELSKLSQQYQKICGAMMVEFRGYSGDSLLISLFSLTP
jgi:oligoendopeptidase F